MKDVQILSEVFDTQIVGGGNKNSKSKSKYVNNSKGLILREDEFNRRENDETQTY